jgi:hypothetical protein
MRVPLGHCRLSTASIGIGMTSMSLTLAPSRTLPRVYRMHTEYEIRIALEQKK